METGELASSVIHEALILDDMGKLQEFKRRLECEIKPKYLGYRIAEKWLSIAWLNDFIAKRANRSKYIYEAIVGILNETVVPQKVFSIKGVIKSFWS